MQVYLNELSLNGQFNNEHHFYEWLSAFLSLRDKYASFSSNLFCHTLLFDRQATPTMTMRKAVKQKKSRDYESKVIQWLSRSGPFVPVTENPPVICYHEGQELINSSIEYVVVNGLHEECFDTYLLSFPDSEKFNYTPLKITSLSSESEREVDLYLNNFYRLTDLQVSIENNIKFNGPSFFQCSNWQAFYDYVCKEFSCVEFSNTAFSLLEKETFSEVVCKSSLKLIKILNDLILSLDNAGLFTPETNKIITMHFSGGRALFTDESKSNKIDFKKEMTFSIDNEEVFCPWHGKISHNNFRMHFGYPLIKGQNKIHIVYLGPKITKR
ncbi:hypothetical protein WKG99_14560 [Pantoea agglomerans]|uniref:hypothetical protein n=1 Tax=Enterobacter agglomerans TaxID=549 RepID=UPI003C7CF076